MFIVLTLIIMGFLNSSQYQLLFLVLCSLVIALKFTPKDAFKLFAFGTLFIVTQLIPVPSINNHYRVIDIRETRMVLKNGVNKVYLWSDEVLEFDAVYAIEGSLTPLETRTDFQRTNRYQGTLIPESITKIKNPRLLHRFLHAHYASHPMLLDFIYKDAHHIVVSLALQFYALERLLFFLTRRFLTKQKRNGVFQMFMALYGFYFGFNLNVVRHLFKNTPLKTDTKILMILLMFPCAHTHIGFILAFFPVLIKAVLGPIDPQSFKVARLFLIHTLMGSVHLVQMLLFKVWIHLFGFVYGCMLIQLNTLASRMIVLYADIIDSTQRFDLRGSIPLLFFGVSLMTIKKPKRFLMVYLSGVLMVTFYPFPRVMFVDVGQGDAILITSAFNAHVTLIDTGRRFALSNVQRAIEHLGVRRIDQLIITHDDLDHNENEDFIKKTYKVKNHITNKGADVSFLTELLFDVHYEESNENSLIFVLQTQNVSFLFTGDAYIEQEAMILKHYPDLNIDVLKLGHHGSKTSTSEKLVGTLQPTYAIASSNPAIYNHPHPDVMHLLHQFKVSLLKTSDYGNITFIMTPLFDFVVSQRGHFGIIEHR